ncbi:ABC transporter substrate-binding protein [Actinophytocola oryzae]|uniref:ABC-type nitrate/sulfonate/bicarbonate transport system substrate-binding protein n=1 Tax=Actinophytocola oryzae TaxID=502181 RepID=A0A4R7W416_9PSEU|nr:ABC transporter substrate-binding protein [Actinophytocola oryzae]TDV56357.1 ABC-type nitrate/sulfonate/bicarbonate transport system substrate-binding protein [Actinophytocola oryzae]
MKFGKARPLVLLVATALASAACGGSSGDGGHIRIAISSESLATQVVRMADDLGMFKAEGLEVELVTSNGGAQAVTAMLSGNVQFASAGAPEVITSNAEGRDVKAIARLYSGLSGSLVLSKKTADKLGVDTSASLETRLKSPDTPIEERFKDLDGLNVAFASATSSLKSPVMSSAEAVGAKVNPVYMKQESMPAALSAGAIDAFQASPPVSELGVSTAGGVMWVEGPTGEFPEDHTPVSSSTLMTTGKFIGSDPDTVKKVSRAIARTAQYVVDNPDKAEANVRTRFKDVDEKIFDAAWQANKGSYIQPRVTADQFEHDISVLPEELLTDDVKKLDPKDLIVSDEFNPADPKT